MVEATDEQILAGMKEAPELVQDESLCTRTLREVREYQAGAAAR